jgi:hypothetical protein
MVPPPPPPPPCRRTHARLRQQEVQQQMLDEQRQHQRLAGSLLEHTGRLSHKYHSLADDYDELQRRCV